MNRRLPQDGASAAVGEPQRPAAPETRRDDPPIAARLIELHTIESETPDAYGAITEITGGQACPFDIKRVYWIYGARADEERGHHAHRTLQQLMIAVAGAFEIVISNGIRSETFLLDSPRRGLLLEPGYWRTIRVIGMDSILLVAASAPFSEGDYIRDHDEFLAYRESLRAGGESTGGQA